MEAYFSGSGDKVSVFKNTLFFFSIRIYFIRLSRPKFVRFLDYFKNKSEAEISKRMIISSDENLKNMFLT